MCLVSFSLTDEESKENWEKHGNPDGPVGMYSLLQLKLDSHFALAMLF